MTNTVGITCGDPSGIGPEVTLKALLVLGSDTTCHYRCYGHPQCWQDPLLITLYKKLNRYPNITFITPNNLPKMPTITTHADHGHIALACIKQATADALSGQIETLITAPISKTNLALANCPHPGHTPLLQALTNSPAVSMAFWSPTFCVILATIHIPLATVPAALTHDTLSQTAHHAIQFCKTLKLNHPKIAIAGLNPHAGEGGLLGRDESDTIVPFIQQWSHQPGLLGPYPADTVFRQAHQGRFDLVMALYHDQGLIPIKLLAFDTAVNVTIGLPFIRTSPDHGTATDIAYQDKANPSAMIAAIKLAKQLST